MTAYRLLLASDAYLVPGAVVPIVLPAEESWQDWLDLNLVGDGRYLIEPVIEGETT